MVDATHLLMEDPKRITPKVRDAVLERDNNQCQSCGTGGENRLQLHHVELRSQGGKHYEYNLVTLCFRCHREVHEALLDIELAEVRPGVWSVFCYRIKHWRTK